METGNQKVNLKNKEVLFLASGSNLLSYKKNIEKYIKETKPLVIALKPKIKFNYKFINYYIACNPLRIMSESSTYNNLKTINNPTVINAKLYKK